MAHPEQSAAVRADENLGPRVRAEIGDVMIYLIRNTYQVLMTRGMRGTVLYAADAETRAYLAGLVRVRRGLETVYE